MALLIPRRQAEPGDVTGPYRSVVVVDDDAGIELWVDFARALHRRAPFDVVVAFNEPTYPVAHAISDALQVPTTVDVDLFGRVLDKSRTRAILVEHGIPSCRYEVVHGWAAIHEAVRRVGFPCIVKPVDGEASLGVTKVGSETEVAAALQRLGDDQIDRGVLVEEFLVGEEFSVESISAGSQHHIVAVTRKFTDELTFVERGHLVPAPLDHATHEAIVGYVRRVLDALGFHDCPSHTEVVLTDAGPRLVETHNRIGGDSIMDLVQLATGIDMYDLVARQGLGENVSALLPDQPAHHQYAAVWFADPSGPPTNTLREVRGVEQVAGLPYVRKVKILKEPGSPQGAVAQSADRSALVVLVGGTAQEALDRAHVAIRMLVFVYTPKLPEESPPAPPDETGTNSSRWVRDVRQAGSDALGVVASSDTRGPLLT